MTGEEFTRRITQAMLEEPVVAGMVMADFPEYVEGEGAVYVQQFASPWIPVHPAADLDAPEDATVDEQPWLARDFLRVSKAGWVPLQSVQSVWLDGGDGGTDVHIYVRDTLFYLRGDEAHAFRQAWRAYLAGDE